MELETGALVHLSQSHPQRLFEVVCFTHAPLLKTWEQQSSWWQTGGMALHRAHDETQLYEHVARGVSSVLLILDEVKDAPHLCEQLRERSKSIGVVLLCGSLSEDVLRKAVVMGLDDYLQWSTDVSAAEVGIRLRLAIARRTTREDPRLPITHGVELDLATQTLVLPTGRVELPAHSFRIVCCLAKARGAVVRPDQLCQEAGIQRSADHANLQTEVWRLRRALGAMGSVVENVRGQGYRLASSRVALRPS